MSSNYSGKDWSNIKAGILLEIDQFLKKKHVDEFASKVKTIFEEAKKEVVHIVSEKDLKKFIHRLDNEKKDIERYVEKKIHAELSKMSTFLQDKLETLESLTGLPAKEALNKAKNFVSPKKTAKKSPVTKKTTSVKKKAKKK
jgi:hypothetical protein